MGFNNGLERKKFEAMWKKLRAEYAAAGMDEAAIEELYQFDLDTFRSDRRYGEHTQAMPSQQFEDDGDPADESNSALLVKFIDSFAVAPRDTDEGNRYGWLDEVESEEVSRALRSLSSQQIEILTLVAFEGYSATEAGRLLGMTQQGVSWHISKMKKILKNLKNNL